MAHDVFLSYAKKDKPAADAVCNVLERNRIRVWMAPRDIFPGVGWAASIIGAINGARAMVLVFSSHANTSPQIEREVERAINKGIPVIPFRIEDVEPSPALEYFISSPHWLDAFAPPFEQHLERLAEAVKRLLESEFARATQHEERRKAAEAEAARLADEERRKQEEVAATRQVEEEQRRQAEVEKARKAEEERRKAAEAEAARLAAEERKRREAAEATRRVAEERLGAESEQQVALPDAAPSLDEAARPAQVFESENLAKIPKSGANRVQSPESARLRSPPASIWLILGVIGGLTLAASVAFYLMMRKDSVHNTFALLSGSESLVAQKGNVLLTGAPAMRAPVTDCDRLAADASDPDRMEGVKGVHYSDQINVGLALPACLSATKAYPAELRLVYQLGLVLYAAKRFEEARTVLVGADNAGNIAAKGLLGTMYLHGQGVAKDEAEAVRLYRQAADLGNTGAMANLGTMYANGWGVAKDEAEAVRLYRQAADLGNDDAMVRLGEKYVNGQGIAKDEVNAVRLFHQAADLGNAEAVDWLGWMYDNGRGVAKDEAKALRLYRQAADLGNTDAMYNLGNMYENGRGVTTDMAKARSYYQIAADRGDSRAKEALKRVSGAQQ